MLFPDCFYDSEAESFGVQDSVNMLKPDQPADIQVSVLFMYHFNPLGKKELANIHFDIFNLIVYLSLSPFHRFIYYVSQSKQRADNHKENLEKRHEQ